jgi:hypothetical protein
MMVMMKQMYQTRLLQSFPAALGVAAAVEGI